MIYERIFKEHQQIQQRIEALQTKPKDFPEGKLVCCHHGIRRKWYLSNGHTRTYIPRSNRQLAKQLAI